MQGLTILLPNNDPNGLKIIEISDWNGKVFIVPRKNLKNLGERPESSMFGVYFLVGEGDDPARKKVYIGESRDFYQRLANHDNEKDFWETAIVFTGTSLDKADVEYLENKALILAKKTNRYEVLNTAGTHQDNVSELKEAAMEAYFERVKLIVALFGIALFQEVTKERGAEELYYIEDVNNKDASGRGALLDTGEFVVFAGSLARAEEKPGLPQSSRSLRRKLTEEGVLVESSNTSYKFSKDHIFRSPSAAGDVVMGRSVNGWTGWKDGNGKTLDENKRT